MHDNDDLRLLNVGRRLWRYRGSMTVCALIAVALAAVYAWSVTPMWRAQALVVPNHDRSGGVGLSQIAGNLGGLASLAGLNLEGEQKEKEVAIALLSSYEVLGEFIGHENLMPELFHKRWDAQSKQWRASWFSKEPPTLDDGVRKFRKDVLTVVEDRRTGLVRVSVEWHDRVAAARWANRLVESVNQVMRSKAIAEARQNRAYLDKELERATVVELREAIYRLFEAELKNEMVATVRSDYAFKVIDPARPPARVDKVRPRRALVLAFGLFAGLAFGVLLALSRNAIQNMKRSEAGSAAPGGTARASR